MIWKLCRLRSSLCLQFKPQHIAAGAAFLAAKFLNVDLSSNQTMWQEFETTPTILQGEECFLKACLGILILHHISYETGRVCSLHNSWYDFAFIEDFMYMFMKLVLYLNHWFDLLIEFRVCSKKNIFCTYLDELTCLRTLQMLYSSWESSVYGIVLRSSKHWVGSVFVYSINHSEIRSQVLERSFGFKY